LLLDDDFGSIVKTIRLGRRIYDNLRKAIEYMVAGYAVSFHAQPRATEDLGILNDGDLKTAKPCMPRSRSSEHRLKD